MKECRTEQKAQGRLDIIMKYPRSLDHIEKRG